MEIVARTAACACFMGIIAAAADMICPSEKYSGRIKLVMSLIFIVTALSGLRGADAFRIMSAPASFDRAAESTRADDYFLRAASENVSRAALEELGRRGIYAENVLVTVDISESGSIYISKAEVTAEREEDIPRVRAALTELFGEDVTVYVIAGTGEENEQVH